MRLLYIALLLSALSFGQDRNGISYQALILNPQGEQLPGANNNTVPMANTEVCLRFHITTNAGSYNEYSERQVLTTDAYGMINTVVGTGVPVGTIMWNQIVWTEDSKGLKVEIDYSGDCSSFVALSSQELTSVPFALYSPASNIPGPPGEAGDSAYQVWVDEGNTGTEQEFLDSLKGTDGEPGDPGADGDSAYQVWIDEGNTGTEQEFLDSLKGTDGEPGDPGADGDSAYQVWIDEGNTGTEQEFLDSLVGPIGEPGEGIQGKSAYEVWIEAGNTGTEQDYLNYLSGTNGYNTLVESTNEPSGSNCISGGIKVEFGIDSNYNGILDSNEVDSSKTKYICNGQNGNSSQIGSSSFFNSIDLVGDENSSTSQNLQTVKVCNVALTHIAAKGSWWTTTDAIGWDSCYRNPNGTGGGGCGFSGGCGIEILNPVPSTIVYEFSNLNSQKFMLDFVDEISICFQTKIKIEFFNSSNQPVLAAYELRVLKNVTNDYVEISYSGGKAENIFFIGKENQLNVSSYIERKAYFYTNALAVSAKLTFESVTPTIFNTGTAYNATQCREDVYQNRTENVYPGNRNFGQQFFGQINFNFTKWQ